MNLKDFPELKDFFNENIESNQFEGGLNFLELLHDIVTEPGLTKEDITGLISDAYGYALYLKNETNESEN